MMEPLDSRYYLDWSGEIGKIHPFIDFHMHPFDVFGGDINYHPDPSTTGLFVKGRKIYDSPRISNDEDLFGEQQQIGPENPRAILLASRFIYTHTGPKVFLDQLDLAGLKQALLLPVVRYENSALHMIETTENLFQQEERFHLACPFPVGITSDELLNFYSDQKKNHKISAIKIHPNLNSIDPVTQIGKELIESTLAASEQLRLPVVVHSGITTGLLTPESKGYSTLERLVNIDWNICTVPVIFAHAGCYGLTGEDISSTILILNHLMDTSPHLLADVSALNLPALRMVMTTVDRNRLLFGSDALYFTVWKAWLRFLYTLRSISPNPDDDLIRIASLNPSWCLDYSSKFE